jgi:prolyl 4-hydroxylase
MSIDAYLRYFPGGLSDDLCGRLIEKFESATEKSKIENSEHGLKFDQLHISTHPEFQEEVKQIQNVLLKAYEIYKSQVPNTEYLPTPLAIEQFRMKKYNVGEDESFPMHVDVSTPESAPRYLGALFYLNTVQEGGETHYPDFDLTIPATSGSILLFPPMWMYPHEGRMPISESKYIISTYFVYK